MDKREEKSLYAINEGIKQLIKEKNYEDIMISDILEVSGVSRSTFYKHFKNKDDVLREICHSIFHHVFSPNLKKETGHDFSTASIFDYKHLITHIFYHIQEERDFISKIIVSSGSYVFLSEFKKESDELISSLVEQKIIYKENIASDILKNQLQESFVSLLTYWIKNGCKEEPERLSTIFFALYQ
jgi:AcrR family transcriptional regulator